MENKKESVTKRDAKKTFLFIGSLIVAIMFITAYAGNSNNNTTTTTTVAYNYSGSVPMIGYANAIVVNYTSSPTINVIGNYNNTSLGVTNYLNSMVATGNVLTYSPNGNQFSVLLNGSFNAYELQNAISSRFGNNTSISSNVYVKLPKTVKLLDGTQKYTLAAPGGEYSIKVTPLPILGSNVSVKILALISAQGQFEPNQTEVTAVS